MGRIFLDPFPNNLHEVFHLRRLRISQHGNDLIEHLPIFLSSDDLLEHANSGATLSLPVPVLRVKCVQFAFACCERAHSGAGSSRSKTSNALRE